MKVLSIDPGYGRVGVAVIEKTTTGEALLFSECIITSAKDDFNSRLLAVGDRISELIKKWSVDTLAMETLFFNSNQKTALRVAEARGAILYIAKSHKLKIHEYTPLQIKIAVTGYGRAPKDQVETMVRNLVNIAERAVLDDEIDAIAVGLTCCASVR